MKKNMNPTNFALEFLHRYSLAVLSLLLSLHILLSPALAQTASDMASMTVEQYNEIKKLSWKDLDKDTYLKTPGGLIADRLDMKPPYVFNFSDGAERKIYLFAISDTKNKTRLSLLAIYKNMKSGKIVNICIPSASSSKQIWGLYIDDLKEADKMDLGLNSCLSFVLSKELSMATSGVTSNDSSTVSQEDDYEFCFPGNALLTLRNGSKVPIRSIKEGDYIEAANATMNKKIFTKVNKVITHENTSFTVMKVELMLTDHATASTEKHITPYLELEATSHHPVMTTKGIKKMKELSQGDLLYHFDSVNHVFRKVEVVNIVPSFKTVSKVYNLQTSATTYLINDLVVLKK